MEKKKRVSKTKVTNVSIPTSLYERIKKRIEETGFPSVSSYVTYILRESFVKKNEKKETFTKNEKEKIKTRLRALGYI